MQILWAWRMVIIDAVLPYACMLAHIFTKLLHTHCPVWLCPVALTSQGLGCCDQHVHVLAWALACKHNWLASLLKR